MADSKPALVLLKLETDEGAAFFVMAGHRYRNPQMGWSTDDDLRYFYEQHSCPTNWLRQCVAVVKNGNEDPHGFLKFVRAVDVPKDFDPDDPHVDGAVDDGAWAAIFPEVIGGGGAVIDGNAVDVSRAIADK